jgi:outer membrane receptor protein involved in Fe transport
VQSFSKSSPLRRASVTRAFAAVVAATAALGAEAQAPPGSGAAQPSAALDEIVVTADFRESALKDLPTSVSVLDANELRATTLQHFEEAIREVPNLNFSGEGSRARYFQLRGVGELEQYEGSPNPSIGFIVDDIDFSGLGSVGTLFDVARVEVLRGPQGTRYGANALGGLIYMRSTDPTPELSANVEATEGSDATNALGAAIGGPLGDRLGFRASVQQYRSDGFRHNVFLDRDDTYGRDELTAHGKLVWRPTDRIDVDFAGLYADIDNGYDAWAIDNGWNTYSDKPGRDAQRSVAGSVRVRAELERFDVVAISGIADTDAVFSFDADWGNAGYWAPYIYDYITTNDRERRTNSEEVRLLSKPGAIFAGRGSWLAGVYTLDLRERNDHLDAGDYEDPFCGPACDLTLDSRVVSNYDARNSALFGELDVDLTAALKVSVGARFERRSASYVDTSRNRFAPTDDMVGGEIALTRRLGERRSTYVRLARGYKAGGFNVALAGVDFSEVDTLTPADIEFGPETLTSLEAGYRATSADQRLNVDIGVFFAKRADQQIKVPIQLTLGDPSSFLLVTANAERARHRGLETTLGWLATDRWQLSATLGLLHTDIDRFDRFPGIEGRGQAHAPAYTYSFGAQYRAASGWWGRVDVSGMDRFYYDYGFDERSKPYALANLRVGRDWARWGATLWVRNLFDKQYFVRGFFFGNEPPDFPSELYTRLGDPRHYGVTLTYHW